MSKKSGLGKKRGLDMLLGDIKKEKAFNSTLGQNSDSTPSLIHIEVNKLQSGKYQPRHNMHEEALVELSQSIAKHGVMQPIVIRPLTDAKNGISHEIIAGERRWRAAKMAGLTHIPAIHRELSDELAIALALIENIQRADLTVLEEAAALERFHSEFGMSHAMIAEVVGKARATVTNLMRLNGLSPEVKALLNEGKLDMGHARALLTLSSEQQPIVAKKIIDNEMTTREAERLVKSIVNPEPKKQKVTLPEIAKLSQSLSDKLGATVRIKQGKDGKGSMEILFFSNDELGGILSQLGIEL